MTTVLRVELYDPGAYPPVLIWQGLVVVSGPGDSHTLRLPSVRFLPRVVVRYPDGRVEDSVVPACAEECGRLLRARAASTGVEVRVSATPPPPGQSPTGRITWVMCEHQEVYMLAPEGVQHDTTG